jgi:hypothetical protein
MQQFRGFISHIVRYVKSIYKNYQPEMLYNVPAVYDVLDTRISKRKGGKYNSYPAFAFAGCPKCGRSEPWERGVADRPRRTEPRAAACRRRKRKQSCYATYPYGIILHLYFFYCFFFIFS